MNMIVTNTASLVASTTNQGNAGKAAGGEGFAGALVQAIGGQTQENTSGNATLLPTGLAALVAQLGTEESQADGETLLTALNEWIRTLSGTLAEDTNSAESGKVSSELTELLTAFQAMLENWTIPTNPTSNNAGSEGESALEGVASTDGDGQTGTLLLLLQTLNQASKKNDGKLDVATLEQVAEQFKQLIAEGTVLNQGQDADTQTVKQAETNRVGILQATGTAIVSGQAATQTIHQQVAPDSKKTAFKEPVIYWNLQLASANAAQEADASVVNEVSESSDAGDNQTTFAWTLQAQDLPQQKPEAALAKPALPAQVPVQQFSQQIGNYLVKQFVLSNGNGFTEARITLTPEHLGTVDVRLSMQDGQLTAQFLTHSGTAKELIENQMSMLRSALQSQGIQVDRIDVVQQPYETSESTSFLSDEDRGSNAGQKGGHSNQSRDESNQDPDSFEDELERTTLIREAGFGSSINTKA